MPSKVAPQQDHAQNPENDHFFSKVLRLIQRIIDSTIAFFKAIKKGTVQLAESIAELYKTNFTENEDDMTPTNSKSKWKKRGIATLLSLGLYAPFKVIQLAIRYERFGSNAGPIVTLNTPDSIKDKWLSRIFLTIVTGIVIYPYFFAAREAWDARNKTRKSPKDHFFATVATFGIYPLYCLVKGDEEEVLPTVKTQRSKSAPAAINSSEREPLLNPREGVGKLRTFSWPKSSNAAPVSKSTSAPPTIPIPATTTTKDPDYSSRSRSTSTRSKQTGFF
jgi:hypothetical protein